MHIDLKLVGMAIGLALVIEGIPYFLLAEKMPEYLKSLARMPPKVLRIVGMASMLLGLFIVWLVKRSYGQP